MRYEYIPTGVCSRKMIIDIDKSTNIINNIEIEGGCAGNTAGICKLVQGRKIDEIISLLNGIPCKNRITSCPDQLSKALSQIKLLISVK